MAESILLDERWETSQGEITDELDLVWRQNDLAIKDKLDTYGQLFDELDAEKKKLAILKASGVERIQAATRRIENLETRLKRRLNLLSGGQKLKGNIYSFNPFLSRQRTLRYPEHLQSSEAYLTIEIREDYWQKLVNFDETLPSGICWEIKKRTGKVSELPEDHLAIETVLNPSVRIT